jgi:hypothetical protein
MSNRLTTWLKSLNAAAVVATVLCLILVYSSNLLLPILTNLAAIAGITEPPVILEIIFENVLLLALLVSLVLIFYRHDPKRPWWRPAPAVRVILYMGLLMATFFCILQGWPAN